MKQFKLRLLITILIFCSFSIYSIGQQAILSKVNQLESEFNKANTIEPFIPISNNQLPNPIPSKILKDKSVFQLNQNVVQNLKGKKESHIKLEFTINEKTVLLKLFEANIFSDSFEAATSTLTSRNPVVIDKGLHYWGVVEGKNNSLASVSFFNNEAAGFIAFNGETYILGKLKNQDYHILYKNTDLNFDNNFSCDVRLPENGVQKQIIDQVNQQRAASTVNCVDIHIEGDYDLYLDFGSSTNSTINYINGLMAQVIILMANDNIDIQVSYINIWTSFSPYNAASNDLSIMLDELRQYGWGQSNGNLVHLITTIGGGGIAYLNVLCNNTYNVGVSNVFTNFNNVPVYSWDVNVVAHELGHNLASPHTHDCAWNGNNTAIDDCGYNYSGGTDGCDGPTPSAGTIMSYCHLYGSIGVNFNLGFGSQPASLIVNTINNKACLNSCAEPTCNDGILNGDEKGVDCGGAACPACPAEACNDLDFDNYTLLSYADQDNGTATISSGGSEIYITGNSWKAISYPLTVTPATVISFDFKSTVQGEIHEIGFDTDLALDRDQALVVYGNQGYAGTLSNPTYNGSGNWQTFTVHLGAQFTGSFNYLLFTCDDDANATGNSYFRDIKIWEDYNSDLACNAPASCANVDLNILFDGFPGQTSWDILDSNGNVVAGSNGNYSGQSGNSSLNTQVGCLPDGCYTFNMYDALGNGMCPFQSSAVGVSTFITPGTLITPGSIVGTLSLVATPGLCGNYQLTNSAGETLASGGGSFGSTQSNSFCLSGGMLQRNAPKNTIEASNKKMSLFEIQPTISNSIINIVLDASLTKATLNIYDTSGKRVETLRNQNSDVLTRLNISNYNPGSYYIQLLNNDNLFTKTFIKY